VSADTSGGGGASAGGDRAQRRRRLFVNAGAVDDASAGAGSGASNAPLRRRSSRLAGANRRPVVVEKGLGDRAHPRLDDGHRVKVSEVAGTVRTWDHDRHDRNRAGGARAMETCGGDKTLSHDGEDGARDTIARAPSPHGQLHDDDDADTLDHATRRGGGARV
jgi:hypothetical protein